MKRCKWCNETNPKYVKYHDTEWGIPNFNDHYLFEMLILESFQAGLSWECVLNKRDAFRKAYDNFDLDKVITYNDTKYNELINNPNIIRNKLKIKASINNAKIFKEILNEYNTFYNYLKNNVNYANDLEYDSENGMVCIYTIDKKIADLVAYKLSKLYKDEKEMIKLIKQTKKEKGYNFSSKEVCL